MNLTGVHHTGLVVRDLERSIYFYHDLLGLTFANEPSPWFAGPVLEKGVRVPNASLRQVSLWAGPNAMVELIEYRDLSADMTEPYPNNTLGAGHLCFTVDDVAAAKAELEAKGVEFYSDVNVVDEGPLAGWRWVYFADPDGLSLELVEVAYYNKEERDANAAAYLASRPSLESLETNLSDGK
ncbi:MAG: glyoxylase family protein [Gaiellaceae bacterium]|jgi:catechol 2,3-dioxygenase-like lactoylglutathione lyase family enzyme|nr:glyoxylase family protein [Gaiellaceae bacterium]